MHECIYAHACSIVIHFEFVTITLQFFVCPPYFLLLLEVAVTGRLVGSLDMLGYNIDIRLEGIGNRARAPYISMERSAGHSWQLLIG